MNKDKNIFGLGGLVLMTLVLTGCGDVQPTSRAVSPLVESPSCYCPSSDVDCGDFSTHDAAQEVFDCCLELKGSDVHRLDGNDNDGLACESLP